MASENRAGVACKYLVYTLGSEDSKVYNPEYRVLRNGWLLDGSNSWVFELMICLITCVLVRYGGALIVTAT